jgi:phosphotriesterase-related protein
MTEPPTASSGRSFAITVLGPIPAEELGVVYPHEHLLTGPPSPIGEDDPDLVLDVPAEVTADLLAFRAAGGRTVVELTTPDYGRDVAGLAQLSRETGVHIVATTGLNKAKYSEGLVDGHDVDHFTSRFVAEVRDGVGTTGIGCGIVKLGTSLNEVHATEETVARAAARAHLETGCPITTHTERGTLAETQLDILTSEGAPATAVTIGHLDFCDDMDVLRRLADRGAYLEFDQIPKPKYGLEATVIQRLIMLVDEGFEAQLLVSGDFSRKSYFGHWSGGPGMDYLLTFFRDRLATALAARNHDSAEVLDRLFVHNPRSALSFRGPGAASTASALGWS